MSLGGLGKGVSHILKNRGGGMQEEWWEWEERSKVIMARVVLRRVRNT